MLFYSHIMYLGEESLSGLVYLVDVCQQLWTSVSSCAEKKDLWVFWEEIRREISFMFQLSINFVLDVSAKIIKIETNKPSVEIQHMQDIDIYNSHDRRTLYLHCWHLPKDMSDYATVAPVQQWEWRAKGDLLLVLRFFSWDTGPSTCNLICVSSRAKIPKSAIKSQIFVKYYELKYFSSNTKTELAIRIIFSTLYYISTIFSFHLYIYMYLLYIFNILNTNAVV